MAQQTVICIKWGTRYGADYVNRLASMIWRNTARPTRVICFTDDAKGIDPRVTIAPLPDYPNIPERARWTGWRKLSLWQHPLADLEGDVLFFDLDVVITGSIDAFFDFEPGRFAVAENWSEMGQNIGNTTVYRFPAGKMTHIYEDFIRDPEAVLAKYRNEQKYISGEAADMVFWPHEWCAELQAQPAAGLADALFQNAEAAGGHQTRRLHRQARPRRGARRQMAGHGGLEAAVQARPPDAVDRRTLAVAEHRQ